MYNTILTALPIGAHALIDRQLRDINLYEMFPLMYNRTKTLAGAVFWKTGFLQSIWMATFIFFVAYFTIEEVSGRLLFYASTTVLMCVLGTVTLEILVISRFWTWTIGILMFLSYAVAFPYFLVVSTFRQEIFFTFNRILGEPDFYLTLFVVNMATFGARFLERYIKFHYFPEPIMKLAVLERRLEVENSRKGKRPGLRKPD